MITLDEYILKNHSELSEDIKCHLSVYTYSDPKACEALHRLFFTSLRQHENNELQSLKDQLEKAEKVIEFYAKKENWTIDGHSFQDELNEIEQGYWACEIRNDGCDFNVATGYGGYGGKKARAYFKEKQEKLKESE